ncbi:hypothetical protein AB835_06905 [Candidatus Endobugula sertula]|uniref:DUF403 domain-containing protein n=1 Tax=Candidatus Endobugula sertula TaxID=62101 RepID=A0A1D2QQC9_9GAMM|nr:hypothetical protein AB835_06905 [Candidatus Endobugula sertula]
MLSRVAERIYWIARYLQRVESAARVVNAYTTLLMDLPKEINISWFNLVTLNSGENEYDTRYKARNERNVVKFTLADNTNPNAMLVSLEHIRENLRTTRDVMPENAWELINGLSSFANNSINNGALNRGKRQEFLNEIINQCQMIQGYISTTMLHDVVWDMWSLGRDLECADMTTRILQAGVSVLQDSNEANSVQTSLIVWGNVLRSSSADFAYRRSVAAMVKGRKVAKFLLCDESYPRSVKFCLTEIKRSICHLPKQKKIMEGCQALDELLDASFLKEQLDHEFLNYLSTLQLHLANLHRFFSEAWFSLDNH